MMSINKHMNIWSNGFKGYCGNSYALVGTDARFAERPSITEVEYVVRDSDEWKMRKAAHRFLTTTYSQPLKQIPKSNLRGFFSA